MTFCCETCPHDVSCEDLTEIVFARPEEIAVEDFFFDGEDCDCPPPYADCPHPPPPRPLCPIHRLELPVSGECEACL